MRDRRDLLSYHQTLLTFGFAQQRRDAILIGLRLPQLHQRQEETLQRVVEGLQESEAQPQALYRHI